MPSPISSRTLEDVTQCARGAAQGLSASRPARLRHFLWVPIVTAVALLFTGCIFAANRKAAQPPTAGAANSRRILLVNRRVYTANDYNIEIKGWQAKLYPAYHDVGIEMEMVRTLDADIAPALSSVCPFMPGTTCTNCTALWVDEDLALQYCGVRKALMLYAYRYASIHQGYKYDDPMYISVYGAPLDSVEILGIAIEQDTTGVGTIPEDSVYLYRGAFVFDNQISGALNDWQIGFSNIESAHMQVSGHVQAHELGHLVYSLLDANYNDQYAAQNSEHNLTYEYGYQCLMASEADETNTIRTGYAKFCHDFSEDGNAANSCYDIIRYGPPAGR